MKKLIVILVLSLSMAGLYAQDAHNVSMEITGCAGFKYGPLWAGEYTLNKLYPLYGNFKLGFGGGLRVGKTMDEVCTKLRDNVETSVERKTQTEVDIPVYLRLNYVLEKLYFNCDLGYSLGIMAHKSGSAPDGTYNPDPHYDGFFVEPQVGYRFSDKLSLALGLRLHQTDCVDRVYYYVTGMDVVRGSYNSHEKPTPALTLRLARHF